MRRMTPTGWLARRYLSQMRGRRRFGEHVSRCREVRDDTGRLTPSSIFGWGVILRFSTLRLGPGDAHPPGPPKDLIRNIGQYFTK